MEATNIEKYIEQYKQLKLSQKRTQYTDQLKDLNAFDYGVYLRKENKPHNTSTDITRPYTGGSDDNPAWKELDRIYDDVERGWAHQDHLFSEEKFKQDLLDFQKNMPNLGDIVFLDHASNKGKYFRCKVEFIPETRDSVVLRYLDLKDRFGQTKMVIADYSFREFPTIHTELPK